MAPIEVLVFVVILAWATTSFTKLTGAEVVAIMVATGGLLQSMRVKAGKRPRR